MKRYTQLSLALLGLCSIYSTLGFVDAGNDLLISRYVAVRLISTHISANNGVGNDWSTYLTVRDSVIKEGSKAIFKLQKRAPLIIEAHAIEADKNYSDVGSNSMIFTYSDLIAIDESRFELGVKVMENGGQNAGKIAEWIFLFELASAQP